MTLRSLAIANLSLGLALGALVFLVPPRFLSDLCPVEARCPVTLSVRLAYAAYPVVAFSVFVGVGYLLAKLTPLGARLLLALPPLAGLASVIGLFGVALYATFQA